MAGDFGAIIWKPFPPRHVSSRLYKPNHLLTNRLTLPLFNFPYQISRIRDLRMAQEITQTTIVAEIDEQPSPKIAKLHHNGAEAVESVQNVASLLRVKKLSENAVLPSRGSSLSAGYDLSSATVTKVPARGKAMVPTDLSIAIPDGTYARIAPRSGLAWKHGIDVGAGVIDADYRGPVGVILFNHSDVDFEVKAGDRVAQLILEKIVTPAVVEVADLDVTMRGVDGFGSTGV